MTTLSFQEQSIAYPPRINLGSLLLIQTPLNIGNQIKMFCETLQGERRLLPDWGLPQVVHSKEVSRNEIAALILANLRKYFRGVEITVSIRDETVLGQLEIDIEYQSGENYGTVTILL